MNHVVMSTTFSLTLSHTHTGCEQAVKQEAEVTSTVDLLIYMMMVGDKGLARGFVSEQVV